MRQQHSFGRRDDTASRRQAAAARTRLPGLPAMDTYEDPVLVKAAAERPWPIVAATLITLGITGGSLYAARDAGSQALTILPVMAIVGVILYLQFRGLQATLREDKERKKRAIQAEYPLIPIVGMIAGAGYFMIAHDQSVSDILAYDWSGIFGMRRGFENAEEPMTETLFSAIGAGGGAGLAVAVGWHKLSRYLQGNSGSSPSRSS
ncbi:hypothetical protein [Roseibium aggregatum]|uniref:Uncharacterized protein n=1 Tax=Roseibium aggregatum TaxID=187304 RepID=A0A939J493_9HYPH|nr:hypothetical protein [Roseibium aggregatum]MBN9671382.1 hypothetical protein [Roseibium aggregatum]